MKAADIPRLYLEHGSLKAIHRATGESWRQVAKHYAAAVAGNLMQPIGVGRKSNEHLKKPSIPTQRIKALKTKRLRHKTYLLTCAQNNTHVHSGVWQNLQALAKFMDAKVMVSTFLYANRSHWQKNLDKGAVKQPRLSKGERGDDDLWFDPAIAPYISNDRVEIAKGLVWCGELNIIPTAASPLSRLEVYTGRASMIVPHVQLAMESIATIGGSGTKLNYTTGTVTQRNYIQRKDGFLAEFHHSYGALVVEVDDAGHWWVRQLNADSEGTIYDLDVKVQGGVVTTGNRVEAITFGDVHVAQIDPLAREATWGKGGMVETLRPRFQFVHDVFDGHARSHHELKDPYAMFEKFVEKTDSVSQEVMGVAHFLQEISRDDCQTVVVNSNHDRHLERWLTENDGRKDPVNAKYWSWLNNQVVDHICAFGFRPDVLELAITMGRYGAEDFLGKYNVMFLDGGSSFAICPKSGGIECALHFDIGPNGSRGSRKAFAKLGRRSNGGHSHSAGITLGAYQSGTKREKRQGYNKLGPSSWSDSDILTYENGKRAIVTFFGEPGMRPKWRA